MFSDPQFWVFIAFIIFVGAMVKPVRKILSTNLDDKIQEIKDGIDEAVTKVIKHISKKASNVKGADIEHVATISSNNDSILGKLIGEAFRQVDEVGIVMMETHELPDTCIEKIEGTQYEMGLKNQHFITNQEKGRDRDENNFNKNGGNSWSWNASVGACEHRCGYCRYGGLRTRR